MDKIAVLYTADRASAVALLRAHEGELAAVYDGTTRGTIEKMSIAAHEGRFRLLIIDSLGSLNPRPMAALRVALTLDDLKIEVISTAEPWLGPSLPGLRHGLTWIHEQEKATRTAAVARGVEMARMEGRRPGRPRRVIPPEAEKLIAGGMAVGAAARSIGVPESSLRRWISELRVERRLTGVAATTKEAA